LGILKIQKNGQNRVNQKCQHFSSMELEQLELRVRSERDKFQTEMARMVQQPMGQGENGNGNNEGGGQHGQQPIAELAPLAFTVNDRFALRKELAW
jgi:hypothetical protein